MRFTILVVILAACSGAPAKPQPEPMNSTSCEKQLCVAEGRALELGTKGRRDFAAAVDAYRRGCEAGAGNGEACRRLGLAYIQGAGVEPSVAEAEKALQQGCKARDAVACWLAFEVDSARSFAKAQDGEMTTQQQRIDAWRVENDRKQAELARDIAARCDGGDSDSCDFVECGKECACDGSSCDEANKLHEGKMCAKGSMLACTAIVGRICNAPADAACAKNESNPAVRAGIEKAFAACETGDAEICSRLPGREVALATLCAANHRGACTEMKRQSGE
jgi:TPR repeat protein